jgi:hypothetical protein
MSPVPQGTAELIAYIFQPSLSGLFSFWSNVYPGLTSWATITPSLRDSEVGYLKGAPKAKRDGVEIVHVLHGARDIESLLDE